MKVTRSMTLISCERASLVCLPNMKSSLFSFKVMVKVGWLVVLRIYIPLAVFKPYSDLEAGDNQSLKFKWPGMVKVKVNRQTNTQEKQYTPDHLIQRKKCVKR